jgi:uncharacterized membrane protein YqjE
MARLFFRLLSAGPRFLNSCHSWVQIQLEILRIEFAQEKKRLLDGFFMLMTAWVLLSLGILMLTVMALLLSWESFKIPMLGILSCLFLSVGTLMLIGARKKFQA